MPGGRPRKPTAVHKMQGTLRTDRHTNNEPVATGEPEKMGQLTGHALKMWKQLVPQLVETGIAKSIDSAELFALCQWWGEFRKWQLDKKADPYKRMLAMATAYKQFRTIAAKFGLSPSDRASLDLTEAVQPGNKFEAFLTAQLKSQADNQ